jgi:hypothetical protein
MSQVRVQADGAVLDNPVMSYDPVAITRGEGRPVIRLEDRP